MGWAMRHWRITAAGLAAALLIGPAWAQTATAPAADAPAAPPPAAPPPAAAAPVPTEPAGLAELRALFGPEIALDYARAVPNGGTLRLERLRLTTAAGAKLEAPEVIVTAPSEHGIGAATARDVVLITPDDDRISIGGFELRGLAFDAKRSGLGRLTLDSLRLSSIVAAGTPSLKLQELRLDGFHPERPGTLAIAGLEAAAEPSDLYPDTANLARLTLSGLDLPGTIVALAERTLPPRPLADFLFEVEGLRLGQQGKTLFGVQSWRSSWTRGETDRSNLVLRGLTIERSAAVGDWLDPYGYEAITGEAVSDGSFDRTRGVLESTRFDLDLAEVGGLGLTFRLSGLTPESMEAIDLDGWRLDALRLRLTDAGLYRHIVAEEAQRRRLPEPKIRADYVADAVALLGGAKAAGSLLPPLQRFLRGEALTLELTLQPLKPVSFEAVEKANGRGTAAVQRLLGMRLEAK